MGLFGKKKQQIEELEKYKEWAEGRISFLESTMPHDIQEKDAILKNLETSISDAKMANTNLAQECSNLKEQKRNLEQELKDSQDKLVYVSEALSMEEFGLYEPRFDFTTVEEYKNKLKQLRLTEKSILNDFNESAKNSTWRVNGSVREGRKMVLDLAKLLALAFNSACDDIVRKVKYTNLDTSLNSMRKQFEKVNKYGRVIGISIPTSYLSKKEEEIQVAFEFASFKEKEKENARELREQEREQRKLEKEIAEQRKKLDKEEKQYSKELSVVLKQLEQNPENTDLLEKKDTLESELSEIDKAKKDVDYREANQRAGYVYVISNIGSFGEGIFKIGMTRRLNPMERVRELGDASVPFNFDVHAMIFSDDAPGLEAALHKRFDSKKLNLVNQRREFFKCSLEEIKQAIYDNYDKTVEFIELPDAEQFRVSEKMREAGY